jgi:hypothetical protein
MTQPTITSTVASFVIPTEGRGHYTLNLWSKGQLLGTATGTSGTLSVPVPSVPGCSFQADVRQVFGGGYDIWIAGARKTFATCGPPVTTTTVPPTTTTTVPVTTTTLPSLPPGTCEHPHIAGVHYTCPPPPHLIPPVTVAAPTPSAPPVAVSTVAPATTHSLAFTGVGTGLEGLAGSGLSLVLLGAVILLRTRRFCRAR